jgi:hypothetical protein
MSRLAPLMGSFPERTRTKADLRAEATKRCKVSKNGFDFRLDLGDRGNGQSSLVRTTSAISLEGDSDAADVNFQINRIDPRHANKTLQI